MESFQSLENEHLSTTHNWVTRKTCPVTVSLGISFGFGLNERDTKKRRKKSPWKGEKVGLSEHMGWYLDWFHWFKCFICLHFWRRNSSCHSVSTYPWPLELATPWWLEYVVCPETLTDPQWLQIMQKIIGLLISNLFKNLPFSSSCVSSSSCFNHQMISN